MTETMADDGDDDGATAYDSDYDYENALDDFDWDAAIRHRRVARGWDTLSARAVSMAAGTSDGTSDGRSPRLSPRTHLLELRILYTREYKVYVQLCLRHLFIQSVSSTVLQFVGIASLCRATVELAS